MAKASKHTSDQRTSRIVGLIVMGFGSNQIIHFLSDQKNWKDEEDWSLSERQIRNYINKAQTYFREEANIDRDAQIGISLKRYQKIFTVAYAAGDYKAALAAQSKINDLFGLNSPVSVDLQNVNINVSPLEKPTDEEIAECDAEY